jgi:energy-coupling factor transporter ATP-binding protein EcfA2
MKIKVKNYQSIKDQTVEVNPGQFACLVGRSDIGKSALIRSVSGLLSNAPAGSEVRLGEDYLQVTLDLDDGSSVTWKKSQKHNDYWIQLPGKQRTKSSKGGRDVPDEFQQLNLLPVKDQDVDENLLVREQFDPPFLENDPRGVASLISRLGSLTEITRARSLADKDIKSDKAEIKRLEKQKQELEPQIHRLAPIKKVSPLIRQLPGKLKESGKIEEDLEKLGRLIKRRQELENRLEKADKAKALIYSVYSSLVTETKDLSEKIKNWALSQQLLAKRRKQKKVLDNSTQCIIAFEDLPSQKQLNSLDPDHLKKLDVYLQKRQQLQQFLKSRLKFSGKIPDPNALGKIEYIVTFLKVSRKRRSGLSELQSKEDLVGKTQKEIDHVQQQVNSFEVCPLCEKPFEECEDDQT